MKTVYIPKGETVRYESLTTEHLVVHGCLEVTRGIKARTIAGSGTVRAGAVNADVIRVDDMDAGSIVCKRLLAKRVQSPEVFASESATVSCFLSAAYVETGRLTVTLSEIDEVKAEEVVNLTPKKRTLFGTLLASLLRSFWTALTVHGQKEPTVMTDACEAVRRVLPNRRGRKHRSPKRNRPCRARKRTPSSRKPWMKSSTASSPSSSWRASRATPSSSFPAHRRRTRPCSTLKTSASSVPQRKRL